jgi:hypothetical protein
MHVRQAVTFERDINDELLYWVVQNEHLRRYTGQPYRLFTYKHPDTIEVNLNSVRHEYLVKFVNPNEDQYLTELLKRIEPVILKIMSLYNLSEHTFTFNFFVGIKTTYKKVSYSFVSKLL